MLFHFMMEPRLKLKK